MMKKIDILGLSFGNFMRRKTRSVLSVLGVVIGTASIVTMLSLGIAVNVNFDAQMKKSGNINELTVYPNWDSETGKETPLTDEALAQISALENIKAVSPVIELSGKIFSGKMETYGNIQGVTAEYMAAVGAKTASGRLLTAEDISGGKSIYCLMGWSIPYNFQKPRRRSGGGGFVIMSGSGSGGSGGGPEGVPEGGYYNDGIIYDKDGKEVGTYPPDIDLLDENTRVKYTADWSYGQNRPGQELSSAAKAPLYNLKTVGILERNSLENYAVYVDMETARWLQKENAKWESSQNQGSGGNATKKREQTYGQIRVLAEDMAGALELVPQLENLGFQVSGNVEWIKRQQETAGMLQAVLAGIGGVALLVAAIGITNTMVMSIYERTREIGIMKVIGCYLKDIRTMFLTEAALIGLFGGLFGAGMSYGVSALLNWLSSSGKLGDLFGGMGMGGGEAGAALSVIPWWLSLVAVAFAILVALISGFFPARRAMRLSALEAMQN